MGNSSRRAAGRRLAFRQSAAGWNASTTCAISAGSGGLNPPAALRLDLPDAQEALKVSSRFSISAMAATASAPPPNQHLGRTFKDPPLAGGLRRSWAMSALVLVGQQQLSCGRTDG
jgi:hypothetical protein